MTDAISSIKSSDRFAVALLLAAVVFFVVGGLTWLSCISLGALWTSTCADPAGERRFDA